MCRCGTWGQGLVVDSTILEVFFSLSSPVIQWFKMFRMNWWLVCDWLPELFWDSCCSTGILQDFCVQIDPASETERASSWHHYLEKGFLSVLEQVPWSSSWGWQPPCLESWELLHVKNHYQLHLRQPAIPVWLCEPQDSQTNSKIFVFFPKNLPWLYTLPSCPGWDLNASAYPHPRVGTRGAECLNHR